MFYNQRVAEELLSLSGISKPAGLDGVPWSFQRAMLKDELDQATDVSTVCVPALKNIFDSMLVEFSSLSPALIKKFRKRVEPTWMREHSEYEHMKTTLFLVELFEHHIFIPDSFPAKAAMFGFYKGNPAQELFSEHPVNRAIGNSYLFIDLHRFWVSLDRVVSIAELVSDDTDSQSFLTWERVFPYIQKIVEFGLSCAPGDNEIKGAVEYFA